MGMDTTQEFDVTVLVRKRLHFSGVADRDQARSILQKALEGGMSPAVFAKYGGDGKPIEQVLSNEFQIDDPTSDK